MYILQHNNILLVTSGYSQANQETCTIRMFHTILKSDFFLEGATLRRMNTPPSLLPALFGFFVVFFFRTFFSLRSSSSLLCRDEDSHINGNQQHLGMGNLHGGHENRLSRNAGMQSLDDTHQAEPLAAHVGFAHSPTVPQAH